MRIRILTMILACILLLSACQSNQNNQDGTPTDNTAALGGLHDSFGEDLNSLGAYDGHFTEPTQNLSIVCISGSANCYKIEGNTITFTTIAADSVYAISGQFVGNIVIDVGDTYKFDLEMHGFAMICETANPITVLSGDEVSLTAKKEYKNYIYDERPAIDDANESLNAAAIYSEVDLEICGKGSLTLVSEYNNGIHTKDDLQVKNLTLLVACVNNALKGNDSVSLENATTTLIATMGDGIKTTNSNISSKGNQRGTVTISGGQHAIYAACDGIDAAYDVMIEGDSTTLNIYTDQYSNYSQETTAVDDANYYIRFTSNAYQYSVKYYNSDDDYCWVDAQYYSSVSSERSQYHYYAYPIMTGYSKVQIFIYSSEQNQSQDTEYLACTEFLTLNTAYDTFAISARGNQLSYQWTNYSTTIHEGPHGPGGPGGMGEGNRDKGDHSTKGIKANNQISITGGIIAIKSYDDAIHANTDNALENGQSPLGDIGITGGNLTLYSNDDGLHSDGNLTITGGSISILHSYEGVEGTTIEIRGGNVSIYSNNDGINATATSGTAVSIHDGTLYIFCSGDGIDANSRSSYTGIVFHGGRSVIITNSGGNSAIDTEQGYTYHGGCILAIMPSGSMTNEAIYCQNFNTIATRTSISVSNGSVLTVSVGSNQTVALQLPNGINGTAIYLGSNAAQITTGNANGNFDSNGVYWP